MQSPHFPTLTLPVLIGHIEYQFAGYKKSFLAQGQTGGAQLPAAAASTSAAADNVMPLVGGYRPNAQVMAPPPIQARASKLIYMTSADAHKHIHSLDFAEFVKLHTEFEAAFKHMGILEGIVGLITRQIFPACF